MSLRGLQNLDVQLRGLQPAISLQPAIRMAAGANAAKRDAQSECAFLVRFQNQAARNAFYATSGKEAGEAEDRARAMLRELVPSAEVAVAVWVVPRERAKLANGAACCLSIPAA